MRFALLSRVVVALSAACLVAGGLSTADPQAAHAATAVAVRTRVLVVDDGQPMVSAIAERLKSEGVPLTTVDLADPGRPVLTRAFLASADGATANFSGVVLPSDTPAGLSPDELASLAGYEADYGVREVDAYTWANPSVGLNYAADPGYVGPVDGMQATISAAGIAGPFSHLRGSLTLDDLDPSIEESWGYLATPLDGSFTPLVTAAIPGTDQQGSLIGVHRSGGRERMIFTFATNKYQIHSGILAHGIVRWLTRDVSLSYSRNWFSVHSDDQYMADALWSIEGNCTIGDGCDPIAYPEDAPGATARMTAGDIAHLDAWQQANGMYVDLAFNGSGKAEQISRTGSDPMAQELKARRAGFRFINHTYSHTYLGCRQDFSTVPWRCATDVWGKIIWTSDAYIKGEIDKNATFAQAESLAWDRSELVTGEHSGLKTLPQMPVDNPRLARALSDARVKWVASDASRERSIRLIGKATTVPRYPMNVYYNVSTEAGEVDEYNWFYTSRANGGSGYCEDHPDVTTCIAPLDPVTGYRDHIVPLETRIAMGHLLGNDPRPHFVHQSNMTDDRILFPVLDSILGRYKATFTEATPIVNPRMAEAGQALVRQDAWANTSGITSSVTNGQLVITNTGRLSAQVPVSVPAGATLAGVGFGEAYADQRSGWLSIPAGATRTITLPGPVGYTQELPQAPSPLFAQAVEPTATLPSLVPGPEDQPASPTTSIPAPEPIPALQPVGADS